MNTCTKCGEEKPLDKFNRRKLSADGLESRCRDCARAYYVANRARILERSKEYRVENREAIRAQKAAHYAENREEILTWHRSHHAENREARNAKDRAYRAEHRERLRALSRAYREARPDVTWESDYRTRCRKYGVEAVIAPFTREELIARYGNACHHCGGPFEHLDHHPVPVALGGEHSLDNCVPSCGPCNFRPAANIGRARTRGNRPTA